MIQYLYHMSETKDSNTHSQTILVRNGLFLSPSRTYGEQYIEPFIRKKYGLLRADNASYDAKAPNGTKYEIKACKVLKANMKDPNNTIIERIISQNNNIETNRLIRFAESEFESYDANVQNVKRDHFDYLIYVLLFEDCVKIFQIKKELIATIPGWSDKHGRYDQLGKSGQFAITRNTIRYHILNHLKDTASYDELKNIYLSLSGVRWS